MDPTKLKEFSKNNLVSSAVSKYLCHILNMEMLASLKKYLNVELFPCLHLKPGCSISTSTTIQWLHCEGFHYTKHKKSLYYDGHDCPDVVQYRQTQFLPKMAEYRRRLVEYMVENIDMEVVKVLNDNKHKLVLGAHNKMTVQANDGKEKSWVLDGKHALKKKGVGHGIHHSNVILSTVGWLKDASQSIEYGKNYDGYWTGEMFVTQVCSTVAAVQNSAADMLVSVMWAS
jgi:hypothetical protein